MHSACRTMLPGDTTNGLDKLTPELWVKVPFHLLPNQANDFEGTDGYKRIRQHSKHQKFLFGTDSFGVDGDSQQSMYPWLCHAPSFLAWNTYSMQTIRCRTVPVPHTRLRRARRLAVQLLAGTVCKILYNAMANMYRYYQSIILSGVTLQRCLRARSTESYLLTIVNLRCFWKIVAGCQS